MIKLANLLAQIYEKLLDLYTNIVIDLPDKVATLYNRVCSLINEIWGSGSCSDPNNPTIPSTNSRIDNLENIINPNYSDWNLVKDDDLNRTYVLRAFGAGEQLILDETSLQSLYNDLDKNTWSVITNPVSSKFLAIRHLLEQEIVYPIYTQAMLLPSSEYASTFSINLDSKRMFDLSSSGVIVPPSNFVINYDNSFNINVKPTNLQNSGRFIDVNSNPYDNLTDSKWIPNGFKIHVYVRAAGDLSINADIYFPTLYLTYASKRITELEFLIQPKISWLVDTSSPSFNFDFFNMEITPFYVFLKKDISGNVLTAVNSATEISSEFNYNTNGTIDLPYTINLTNLQNYAPSGTNLSSGDLPIQYFRVPLWSSNVQNATSILFPPESVDPTYATPFIGIGFKASMTFNISIPPTTSEHHLIVINFENLLIYGKQKLTNFWASENYTQVVII